MVVVFLFVPKYTYRTTTVYTGTQFQMAFLAFSSFGTFGRVCALLLSVHRRWHFSVLLFSLVSAFFLSTSSSSSSMLACVYCLFFLFDSVFENLGVTCGCVHAESKHIDLIMVALKGIVAKKQEWEKEWCIKKLEIPPTHCHHTIDMESPSTNTVTQAHWSGSK